MSLFPPFGEIVILITQFGKTQSLKLCPLYLFVFSTHFNPNIWIFFFSYSIVKFHVALLLFRFLFASPSRDDQAIKFSSLELCLSGLPDWSVWMDSNHRPRAYQARALATWATDRFSSGISVRPSLKVLTLMVEMKGFEPLTPCLQGRCSPNWATPPFYWVCFSGLLIESWQLNNKIY